MRKLVSAIAVAALVLASSGSAVFAAGLVATYPVGIEPWGVAVDPVGGRVYVANSRPDPAGNTFVSVVDPASAAVARIPTSEVSAVVAIDPSLRRLYITQGDGALLVVDLDTAQTVTRVPSVALLGLAVDTSAHRVYSTTSTNVFAIDGVTNTVVASNFATADAGLRTIALDATTHRVYLLNLRQGSPSVDVLDDGDLHFVGRVALPDLPWAGLAVDPARQLVYVTGFINTGTSFSGYLHVVDAATLQITSSIRVGDYPIGITRDAVAHRLYVTNLVSQDISGVDDQTLAVVSTIPLPWQPSLSALHPDGRLYVSGYSSQVLGAVDLSQAQNNAPVVDSVRLDPSAPVTNDVLRAVVSAHDPDGDALTYAFTWKVNGTVRRTASGASAADSFDLSIAGNGDRGDTITVEVTVSDGRLQTAAGATALVANSTPQVSVSLNTTTPTIRDVLVATSIGTDADGDGLTYTYTWSVNANVKRTVTTTATSDSFDIHTYEIEQGDVVVVRVVASDGSAFSSTASAAATVTRGKH